MDRIMIIGHSGQDGTLLFERLDGEGRLVQGIGRTSTRHNLQSKKRHARPVDILDRAAVENAVRSFGPDAIFYLAAYHHSADDPDAADSAKLYLRSHDIHVRGLLNVLEAVKRHASRTRIFYAASSHCFGRPATLLQDESTPLRPFSPYGITKTTGVQMCRMYRDTYGVRVSVGFLYNHESPLRKPSFVSSRIVRQAVDISRGCSSKLELGDLYARVDWGYAPDYVDAMIRILQLEAADDFVIATKESHSVEEFVDLAFAHLGVDWRLHVEVQPSRVVKRAVELVGDNSKLCAATGWSPSVDFAGMVHLLVDAELRRAGYE